MIVDKEMIMDMIINMREIGTKVAVWKELKIAGFNGNKTKNSFKDRLL